MRIFRALRFWWTRAELVAWWSATRDFDDIGKRKRGLNRGFFPRPALLLLLRALLAVRALRLGADLLALFARGGGAYLW